MANHETRLINCSPAEREWLSMRDGRLARAMSILGSITRPCHASPFHGLVHAITGQQISGHAHAAIWKRLQNRSPRLDPQELLRLKPEDLRSCGISSKKIEYLRYIAKAFADGELDAAELGKLDDEELSRKLLKIPGIGPWTVEMLQIFTFRRRNIMSFGDLGIRRGLERLHGLEKISKDQFMRFRELYSPCGTAASLYLWEIAGQKNWPAGDLRAKNLNVKN